MIVVRCYRYILIIILPAILMDLIDHYSLLGSAMLLKIT